MKSYISFSLMGPESDIKSILDLVETLEEDLKKKKLSDDDYKEFYKMIKIYLEDCLEEIEILRQGGDENEYY